ADTVNAIQQYGMRMVEALSPVFGPMTPIEMLQQVSFEPRTQLWIGLGVVILLKAAAAGLLFGLTGRTFDRCLGRVPEARSSRRFEGTLGPEEPTSAAP